MLHTMACSVMAPDCHGMALASETAPDRLVPSILTFSRKWSQSLWVTVQHAAALSLPGSCTAWTQ